MEENIKVRKDYRALKPAERERYFTCLKMLEILPPTEPGNKREYYNIRKVRYYPNHI